MREPPVQVGFAVRIARASRRAALGVLVLALAGCSPVDVLNAWAPTGETLAARGLAYGPQARQRLDVYRPPDATAEAAPVVVFFYGGRWSDGARGDYRFVGAALAEAGIVTIIPDYRLYPAVRFPAFVEDGAAAVRWTLAEVGRWGGDPARVHLLGHSAGAHIAALLALDRRYLGARAERLAGMIGLAGPYDFLPLEAPDLQAIFGPPERYPRSQPIRFARGDAAPLLLLHGADDTTVEPGNSTRLARAVRAAGGRARARLIEDANHVDIVGALAPLLSGLAPAVRPAVFEAIGAPAADRSE